MEDMNHALDKVKGKSLRVAVVHKLSFNEPMGIGYLSAYLKMHFPYINVEFFNTNTCALDDVKAFQPNLVLYSVMTGQHKEYLSYNIRLKERLDPFISVFGGPHPTFFPEMIAHEGVDIICRGEGEVPLKNLVGAVISCSDFRFIKSLWVKYEDSTHRNEVDHLVEDLDNLPFPDRNLYYKKSAFLRSYGRRPMVGARGCPFKCSYCYNSGLNELFKGKGRILRYRSPQSVVDEAVSIKSNYGVRFIAFIEDVFSGVRLGWLKEFCERYSRLDIPFFVSIRAEFVKPEVARYLRKCGCISASMAIEHGDYDYRRKYLFRNMTNEMLIEGTRILESEGIRVASPIILGLPFTDINDELKTLKLACESKPTHATTAVFQPYPGTALTDICLEHGLIDSASIDNLPDDFFSAANIKYIDYAKVLKLHNSFTVLWLMNKWFNVDVEKWFYRLPNSMIIRLLNMALKYLTFVKIIGY
ncbi:MAG: radical SAM protein, partial [Thermodesulfobacteriota bacterium]|nr:radical SAM protein [Thermodesulfobacteriota bacterium]